MLNDFMCVQQSRVINVMFNLVICKQCIDVNDHQPTHTQMKLDIHDHGMTSPHQEHHHARSNTTVGCEKQKYNDYPVNSIFHGGLAATE